MNKYAEAMAGEKKLEQQARLKAKTRDPSSRATAEFKLNPDAPEFIPDRFNQMPIPNCSSQYHEYLSGSRREMRPNCIYFEDQKPMNFVPDSNVKAPDLNQNNNDLIQKIVKQVEYQFSDANLTSNDFLVKIMNKDPEGYVPVSVIASWKKIKNLGANNQMLIKALRRSSKLVVSEDGKKVRRTKLFTEKDKEDIMSRTVIVENLPEDFSRHNIEKLFSVVGSVKNIKICQPQETSTTRPSKIDVNVIVSNKLHALVEFERTDQAEKAPRSVIRSKKSDYDQFDLSSEDDRSPLSQNLESPKTGTYGIGEIAQPCLDVSDLTERRR